MDSLPALAPSGDPLRRVRSDGDIHASSSRLSSDRRSARRHTALSEVNRGELGDDIEEISLSDLLRHPSSQSASRRAVSLERRADLSYRTHLRAAYRPRGIRGIVRNVYAFFGFGTGNRARKELVSLVWNISFGFVQVRTVAIAVIVRSNE